MQELDSKLDQLRHQLATMPETKALEVLIAAAAELVNRVRDAQIRVDELAREQRKAEADVEQVRTRRSRDQERMDSGQVTSPKDLERMQQELVSLERRIGTLEDAELEVMEQAEIAQAELAEARAQLAVTEERVETTTRARDAKAAQVQEQLEEVARERTTTASGLPENLLTLYAKLRAQKGGVGVGALRARRCSGCGLDVNPADMGVIAKAAPDDVLRCEECDRILVRTSESGI